MILKKNWKEDETLKIEFKDNYIYSDLKDILLKKDNKVLRIFYSGNGDLYFDIISNYTYDENNNKIAFLEFDKNDVGYNYFNKLFNDIVNCNVYAKDNLNTDLAIKRANQKLVNNGIIEWYSDSIYDEKANLLKIINANGLIRLTFVSNREDPCYGFSIRICNSGSKYYPFNICFMNLYNQFQLLANKEKETKKILTK